MGTFGVFVVAETVSRPILNYIGIGVAAASFILYFFVKTELPKEVHVPSGGSDQQQQLDTSLNWV